MNRRESCFRIQEIRKCRHCKKVPSMILTTGKKKSKAHKLLLQRASQQKCVGVRMRVCMCTHACMYVYIPPRTFYQFIASLSEIHSFLLAL